MTALEINLNSTKAINIVTFIATVSRLKPKYSFQVFVNSEKKEKNQIGFVTLFKYVLMNAKMLNAL